MIVTPYFIFYTSLIAGSTSIGLVGFKHLSGPYRFVVALLSYSLFSEVMSRLFLQEFRTANPLYHIYAVVSFVLYVFFFHGKLTHPFTRAGIKIAGLALVPAALVNTIWFQGLLDTPSHILLFNFLVLSLLSVMLFFQLLQHPTSRSIFRNPDFWFVAGTLLFNAASFIFLGFDDLLIRKLSHETQVLASQIHLFFPMLMYVCYGISLALDIRQSRFAGQA